MNHPEEARQLVKLLKDKKHLSYVNLIPYNPVESIINTNEASKENILKFYEFYSKMEPMRVRVEQGTDIDAACGQLRSKQIKKEKVRKKKETV